MWSTAPSRPWWARSMSKNKSEIRWWWQIMKKAINSSITFAVWLVALPITRETFSPPLKLGRTCDLLWSRDWEGTETFPGASHLCSILLLLWVHFVEPGTIGRDHVQRAAWLTASIHLQAWEQAALDYSAQVGLLYDCTMWVTPSKAHRRTASWTQSKTADPRNCEWMKFSCFEPLSLCGLYVAMANRSSILLVNLLILVNTYVCVRVCVVVCMCLI